MKEAILHGQLPPTFPREYSSLAEMLIHVARKYPNKGMFYIDSSGQEVFCSYLDLLDAALKVLKSLQQKGFVSGNVVILEISESRIFYPIFWACILGGIIPAPITKPLSFEIGSEKLSKLFNIWEVLGQPIILIEEKYRKYYEQLSTSSTMPKFRFFSDAQLNAEEHGTIYLQKPEDLAVLQFSSGSTAGPKGIQLTNSNIITNILAVSHKFNLTQDDNTFTWVPHTHDMGLFMQYLSSVVSGCNIIIFSPYTFIRFPYLFLKKVDLHKGTWFTSPNFGFDWMTNNISDTKLPSLNLSSLRFVVNAAEPISVDVVDNFIRKFSVCGFKRSMLCTAYGLAEATVAVTISAIGQAPKIERLDRLKVINDSLAVSIENHNCQNNMIEFFQEGSPIDGVSVRIADEFGNTVKEKIIGEIQIKGLSVTSGYFNYESANQKLFQDGWLHTGDLGFINEGALIITGRMKDIIFLRGQNYYSHDLEEIIFKEKIVPRGNLAFVGLFNTLSQQEELIGFIKYRSKIENLLPIRKSIINIVQENLGIEIKHIIPVQAFPKTTSGKLQRFCLRKNYENGMYEKILNEIEKSL